MFSMLHLSMYDDDDDNDGDDKLTIIINTLAKSPTVERK